MAPDRRAAHRLTPLLTAALIAASAAALPSTASAFDRISQRAAFVGLVEGRTLNRLGITLRVGSDGRITGRAFGRDVSGRWQWSDGWFCRSLAWGSTRLDDNCQLVQRQGSTLRFTSDRGTGDSADLSLR